MSNKVRFDEMPESKSFKILLWILGIAFVMGMILAALQAVGTIDINYGELSYTEWFLRHNQSYEQYLKQQEHQSLVGQVSILVLLPLAYAFFCWLCIIYAPSQWTKCQHGHVIGKNKLNKYCRVCGVKLNTEEPLA